MADPVTSGTSSVKVGKESIFTATKVTGPNGKPPEYTTEIIKYDSADGSNHRTIATTDKNGKMEFTENASEEDKKAASEIRKASRTQVTNIADQVATSAEQKEALNKASNNTNKAIAEQDLQNNLKLFDDAKADFNKENIQPGTREDGFGFHIFPETLRINGNGQDFLKIDMMKYQPRGLKQSSGLSLKELGFQDRDMNRKSIGAVVLPIPGGIKDNQQVSWSSDNMTAMQLAASDIALSTITPFGSKYNILSFVSISSDSNNEAMLEKTPIVISNKKKAVILFTKIFLNPLSRLSINDNIFLIFFFIIIFF